MGGLLGQTDGWMGFIVWVDRRGSGFEFWCAAGVCSHALFWAYLALVISLGSYLEGTFTLGDAMREQSRFVPGPAFLSLAPRDFKTCSLKQRVGHWV